MLLEFRCANYRSFKEELVFNMKPSTQKGLDYSIQKVYVDKKEYKALSSAVIYGPNASGKTNIISAMDTFKKIIERGNINNSIESTPNYASSNLELIPNYGVKAPTSFCIQFIQDDTLFDYSLIIDLGEFLNVDYDRKVLHEELKINQKLIFCRENNRVDIDKTSYDYDSTVFNVFENAETLANVSLKDTELFLTNGFKTIFSTGIVEKITDWFTYKFIIVVRADSVKTNPSTSNMKENQYYIEENLSNALSEFGINNNVAYKVSKNGNPSLVTILKNNRKTSVLPSDLYESYGTIRFINEFPLIMDAFVHGGTLVIDEFDASLHPIALMSIINVFHNDDINKKNAQLIFNTHNPIFLDHSLFRRDEIKFVEMLKNGSVTYSLSDFKTSNTTGTRGNSDFLKNYFVNRYGAISNVDFSPVFENIMNSLMEDSDGKQ